MTIGPPPSAVASLRFLQDTTVSAENQYLLFGNFNLNQFITPFFFIMSRAITIFWISFVPSKIGLILASR
jgi:hypothetical protein